MIACRFESISKSSMQVFVALLIAAVLSWSVPAVSAEEFRGVWADAFHEGYKSVEQIDNLVERAATGNYNAIIAEVLAYHDTVGSGHGAYWASSIVPMAVDIDEDLEDPLAYLIEQAHARGIEVHCWLVAFRASKEWPPADNPTVADHPEWIMVPREYAGEGPSTVDDAYTFDPGCPEVQEYLLSIIRELVTNYEIDGINWDYIRYTTQNAGYPSDLEYENSGLARYQRIYGTSEVPSVEDSSWSDFRRRTISELVRRCRAEIPLATPDPDWAVRLSADLIMFGNAPEEFEDCSAYTLHQNWKQWMENGWLDAAIPMNYKREHNELHAGWYRNWVDAAVAWRGDRQVFCGQATYLNSMANSVAQMEYCRSVGANGTVNYSYAGTADENMDGSWENDWSWYEYVGENYFDSAVDTPSMPWRDPELATEGTLFGQVVAGDTGEPVDDATVFIDGVGTIQTDGNGYYTLTLIPAEMEGTEYDVLADSVAYEQVTAADVVVKAGDVVRQDIEFGSLLPPSIAAVWPDPDYVIEGQEYSLQLSIDSGTVEAWQLSEGPDGATIGDDGIVSGWYASAEEAGSTVTFTAQALNGSGTDEISWQVRVFGVDECDFFGQSVWSDDFNTDTSISWFVFSHADDYTAEFAYDYSQWDIPAAPNSLDESTLGLRLTVNNNDDVEGEDAVSLFPIGQQFEGNYSLHFDMWINYTLEYEGGQATTEFATAGINHSGTELVWFDSADSNGFWFGVTGDGGASSDYQAYHGSRFLSAEEGGFVAGSLSSNAEYYQNLFASDEWPSWGVPGNQWVDVQITQNGDTVEWWMNGALIASREDAQVSAGTIMLGCMDFYPSVALPVGGNFVLFDNVEVTVPPVDCDGNGVPDECEMTGNDCNSNGVLDVCDVASGDSEDCNTNGLPDECESDSDGDGIIDDCESGQAPCGLLGMFPVALMSLAFCLWMVRFVGRRCSTRQ